MAIEVYHYTDEEGMKGIRDSGLISPSTDTTRDTKLGIGVYLTTVSPYNSSIDIALNNWDEGPPEARRRVEEGLTDYVVALRMPEGELKKSWGGRDVRMKPGMLRLADYPHAWYHRKEDEVYELEEDKGFCNIL